MTPPAPGVDGGVDVDVDVDVDVAVVGAGPAGSAAALAAAGAGARVALLDRARFPRYKRCGGGLVGLSLGALPLPDGPPARDVVDRLGVSLRAGPAVTRRLGDGAPLLPLVARADLDTALVRTAVAAGARLHEGVTVRDVAPRARGDGPDEDRGAVVLATSDGPLRARVVVGADGSASRVARHVGVVASQVDVGLEAEVPVPPDVAARWRGRVLLDFGPVPGSYAWVFPKGDVLTVGIIGDRALSGPLREDLARLRRRHGLDGPAEHEGGHLTRVRAPGSPLRRGRVLVAGDAAGLLEPWTREGISFALRSGRLAGEAAAAAALGPADRAGAALDAYPAAVEALLSPEVDAGRRVLEAFRGCPAAFAALLVAPGGWELFTRLVRGDSSVPRQLRRPAVRAVVRVLAGAAGTARTRDNDRVRPYARTGDAG